MEIWNDVNQLPGSYSASVITIGNFDGVHLGHQQVLTEVQQIAQSLGLISVAVTFTPHPSKIHRPREQFQQIYSLERKLDFLSESGIDASLVLQYSLEFSQQSPQEFVQRYFVDLLKAKVVIVGSDVRFGKGNVGDIELLKSLGKKYGFEVREIQDIGVSGYGSRCSSTLIRELLNAGKVKAAQELLGRKYSVVGQIVHGDARGDALLGIPTANLGSEIDGILPGDGIYAGWVKLSSNEKHYPAAISIGTNPTFGEVERRLEAHLLSEESLDLYGLEVEVIFTDYVRSMQKFDSVTELIVAIEKDIEITKNILASDIM